MEGGEQTRGGREMRREGMEGKWEGELENGRRKGKGGWKELRKRKRVEGKGKEKRR